MEPWSGSNFLLDSWPLMTVGQEEEEEDKDEDEEKNKANWFYSSVFSRKICIFFLLFV